MNIIQQAADRIKSGNIVAFPTETVYGVGADATNQLACLKLYQAKGRPSHNPIIVHVNSIEQLQQYAEFNNNAQKVSKLWPGPLTMVLKKRKLSTLADCVTAGLNTVAIRIPSNNIARKLIEISECPIAAPSANKSGYLSATKYHHVYNNFTKSIIIIEDPHCSQYGIESTIIDLSTSVPSILRLGSITPDMIEKLLGKKIKISSKLSYVKSPGMLLKHYSTHTILRLNAHILQEKEIGLNFADSNLKSEHSLNLSIHGDLNEAASNLFNYLHHLDDYAQKNNIKCIAIAPIPHQFVGLAINDRLLRASIK